MTKHFEGTINGERTMTMESWASDANAPLRAVERIRELGRERDTLAVEVDDQGLEIQQLKEERGELQSKCEHLRHVLDCMHDSVHEWHGCPAERELIALEWCRSRGSMGNGSYHCRHDDAHCWNLYVKEQIEQQPEPDQEVR
jgi:uncharacterized protein YhaN